MSRTRAISTTSRRELSSSFFFPCKTSRRRKFNAFLTETLACLLPGRAEDLSASLCNKTSETEKLSSMTGYVSEEHDSSFFKSPNNLCLWAHHQEVKIALHSLWYHHTKTSEWSKITKIKFYKYWTILVILDHSLFSVWWYQRLCNAMLTSWWWAHGARNM